MLMTFHINIPLPNDTYKRAQRMAHQVDKEVSEFLADHLTATLPDTAVKPQTVPEQERAAYLSLHPYLVEKYLGEYVAIYRGQLIDHDVNQLALVNRLDQTYPNQFVLVRQVTIEPEPEYRRIAIRWAE